MYTHTLKGSADILCMSHSLLSVPTYGSHERKGTRKCHPHSRDGGHTHTHTERERRGGVGLKIVFKEQEAESRKEVENWSIVSLRSRESKRSISRARSAGISWKP